MITKLYKKEDINWHKLYFASESPTDNGNEKVGLRKSELSPEVINHPEAKFDEIEDTNLEQIAYENDRIGDLIRNKEIEKDLNDLSNLKEEHKEILKSGNEIIISSADGRHVALATITSSNLSGEGVITFKNQYNSNDKNTINLKEAGNFINSGRLIGIPNDIETLKQTIAHSILNKTDKDFELPESGFFYSKDEGHTIPYTISGNNVSLNGEPMTYSKFLTYLKVNKINDLGSDNDKDNKFLETYMAKGNADSYKRAPWTTLTQIFGQISEIAKKVKERWEENSKYGGLFVTKKLPILNQTAAGDIASAESKKVDDFKSDFDGVEADDIIKSVQDDLPLAWYLYTSFDNRFFAMGAMIAFLEKTGGITPNNGNDKFFFDKLEIPDLYKQFEGTDLSPEDKMVKALTASPMFSKAFVVKVENAIKSGKQAAEGETDKNLDFSGDKDRALQNLLWMVGFNDSPEKYEQGKSQEILLYKDVKYLSLDQIRERIEKGNGFAGELDPVKFWEITSKAPVGPQDKFLIAYMFVCATTKNGAPSGLDNAQANKISVMAREKASPIIAMMNNEKRPKLHHLMTKTTKELGITNIVQAKKLLLIEDDEQTLITSYSHSQRMSDTSRKYADDYIKGFRALFKTDGGKQSYENVNARDFVHETITSIGFGTNLYLKSILCGGTVSDRVREYNGNTFPQYYETKLKPQLENLTRITNGDYPQEAKINAQKAKDELQKSFVEVILELDQKSVVDRLFSRDDQRKVFQEMRDLYGLDFSDIIKNLNNWLEISTITNEIRKKIEKTLSEF